MFKVIFHLCQNEFIEPKYLKDSFNCSSLVFDITVNIWVTLVIRRASHSLKLTHSADNTDWSRFVSPEDKSQTWSAMSRISFGNLCVNFICASSLSSSAASKTLCDLCMFKVNRCALSSIVETSSRFIQFQFFIICAA